MPAQQFTSTLLVKVDGAPLPDDVAVLLDLAVVDDDAVQPDMFTLRFRDPDRLVLAKARLRIGSHVLLSVSGTALSRVQELMQGEVTALEAEADGTGTFTTVRGYDQSHRLMRGTTALTYLQSTYSDIVKKVAQRNGLPVGTVNATTVRYDYVEQAHVSDWDFVRRLASEVGYEVGVEKGKLYFREPVAASGAPEAGAGPGPEPLALQLGHDLIRVRSAVSAAGQVTQVSVRGWDPRTQRVIVGTAPAATSALSLGVVPRRVANSLGAKAAVVTDLPYRVQAAADAAARSIADRIAAGVADFDGQAIGNPQLASGTAVSISNLGPPFDGKYTLTSVRHVFDPSAGYTTSFTVSGRHDRSLPGLTRGGAAGTPPRVPGVAVGIVTDIKDPDTVGRVKVKLPWLDDTFVTDWARVLQPGAGTDRGMVLLPEVDDEVLVAFEQGDLRQPYVLGGVYSAKKRPKKGRAADVDAGTGQAVRRALVTRTGHSLEFVESPSVKGIHLVTGDGKLEVSLDGVATKLTVRSDGTVLVQSKQGVTVDGGTGPVKVTGQKIELAAKSGVSIDGGAGPVEVKGVKVAVNGTAAVDVTGAKVAVQGSATAELKAGALLTVQGALVKIN